MHGRRLSPGSLACLLLLATLAFSSAQAPVALSAGGASAKTTRYAEIRRACPPASPGRATCFALVRVPVSAAAAPSIGARPYTPGDGAPDAGPGGGLSPAQLARAYGYETSAGGSGQTVALVDAYDDPDIEKDLGVFDEQYGLAACTAANECFTKVGQGGSAKALPKADKKGWSVEISLDVETVRAVCPSCKILLVEANNEEYKSLAAATNEAVKLGASEVSNSYGGPESEMGASEREAYNHPKVVITASTGDDGYYDWDELNEGAEPPQAPNAPASLSSVVAVGGTTLRLAEDGVRASETVWNNNGPGDEVGLAEERAEGATGGGCSTLFAAQPWQRDVSGFASTGCGDKRLDADIAAVADPDTGFALYDTDACGTACTEYGAGKGWVTIGGTSLSSPLIASLYALAGGSAGVDYPALTLYGHVGEASALYDVIDGGSGFCGGEPQSTCGKPDSTYGRLVDCEGTSACNAAPGLDGPSGVGVPNGLSAFSPRLPSAVITPPKRASPGIPASFSAAGSHDPYPGGTIESYKWNWGDGSAESSEVAPTHSFAAVGAYTVTLTVTDNYGFKSVQASESVLVREQTLEEREREREEEAAQEKQEEEAAASRLHEEAQAAAAARRHAEELAALARRQAEAEAKPLTDALAPPTVAAAATGPNSSFRLLAASVRPATEAISLTASVANPGAFTWLLTLHAPKPGVLARRSSQCTGAAAKLSRSCRASTVLFGKGAKSAAAGTVSFTVKPSSSALKVLRQALKDRLGLTVTIRLSFQSALGGSPVSHTRLLTVKPKRGR